MISSSWIIVPKRIKSPSFVFVLSMKESAKIKTAGNITAKEYASISVLFPWNQLSTAKQRRILTAKAVTIRNAISILGHKEYFKLPLQIVDFTNTLKGNSYITS